MGNSTPHEGIPVQPTPVPTQLTPVPAQPIQSTQPIIQIIMPENKPAEVDIKPKVIQNPVSIVDKKPTGENGTLKKTNRLYGALLIGLTLIIIAGITYRIDGFRTPKIVEPDPINISNPEYIPTTTSNNPTFFNNQPGTSPGNSNPEGSDIAPPGGVTVD